MNNRDYKQFAVGEYYHIYNRGVGKMNIFEDEADYFFFLKLLKENLFPEFVIKEVNPRSSYIRQKLPSNSFTLISYCLMPNHFHLLIRQDSDIPVSKFILKVCTSYSKYFNRKNERVGSVFQGTFKAVNVDNTEYLYWLSAYIHQNPKVAKLVDSSENWQYSSYRDYLDLRPGQLCNKDLILKEFRYPNSYRDFVEGSFEITKNKKDLENLLLE